MNSLNFLPALWPLEVRHARSPHTALWHELFRFSGRETSEVIFRESHADPNYLQPFLHAIALADDMVRGWEDVEDDFTGCILLYYGALWLGNAVTFSALNGEHLKRRRAAHGLNVTFDFRKRYPLLEANIDPGHDDEAFGMINAAFGGSSLAGQTFQTKDFIAALPEMRSSLTHVHLQSRAVEGLWIGDVYNDDLHARLTHEFPNIEVDLYIDQTPTPSWIRDNLAIGTYLTEHDVTNDPSIPNRISWQRAKVGTDVRSPEDELLAISITADRRRFFLPTVKRRVVSEFAMYLAVLYVISVAARYYPDYWIMMQQDRTPEFFLVREFLDAAEDKVPTLVLNHLHRRTFVFNSL